MKNKTMFYGRESSNFGTYSEDNLTNYVDYKLVELFQEAAMLISHQDQLI